MRILQASLNMIDVYVDQEKLFCCTWLQILYRICLRCWRCIMFSIAMQAFSGIGLTHATHTNIMLLSFKSLPFIGVEDQHCSFPQGGGDFTLGVGEAPLPTISDWNARMEVNTCQRDNFARVSNLAGRVATVPEWLFRG